MVLVSRTVTIVKAKIVKVAVRQRTASSATVVVIVNARGRVSAGGKTVRLRAPGRANFRLKLPRARAHVKVTFIPATGAPSVRIITI